MLEDIAEMFRHELNPGEKLIWVGQPQQGIMLRPSDTLEIPFSIMWAGFAFFWEGNVLKNFFSLFFALWGIPFVLMGLYMLVGRFFYDMFQRQKTYYALTNERALIITGLLRSNIKSIDFRKLTEINISTNADGKGTITFGPVSTGLGLFANSGIPTRSRYYTPTPNFEMIENAQKVYQRIKELQRES